MCLESHSPVSLCSLRPFCRDCETQYLMCDDNKGSIGGSAVYRKQRGWVDGAGGVGCIELDLPRSLARVNAAPSELINNHLGSAPQLLLLDTTKPDSIQAMQAFADPASQNLESH